MITPLVEEYLSAYLQGHRSADDTKQILRLIDENQGNNGALEAEFDDVLRKVSKNIPGLTLDFEKLLASDEIECDPLVSQGNLAILRLDNLFRQAYSAWMQSGSVLHTIKRIAKPENPATYSASTQQQIRTEETYPPDAQILNQVVNITLSGFRIQATITHRREKLKSGNHDGVAGDGLSQSNPASKKDLTDNPPPESCDQAIPSQPEASARNAAQSTSLPESNPDIIDENEIFNSDVGDFTQPIEASDIALIRGVNRISGIKGYNPIEPLVSPTRKRGNEASSSTEPADQSELEEAENASSKLREEEPVTESLSAPPCETILQTANNVSQDSREEEPVTLAQSTIASSPTDHWPPAALLPRATSVNELPPNLSPLCALCVLCG